MENKQSESAQTNSHDDGVDASNSVCNCLSSLFQRLFDMSNLLVATGREEKSAETIGLTSDNATDLTAARLLHVQQPQQTSDENGAEAGTTIENIAGSRINWAGPAQLTITPVTDEIDDKEVTRVNSNKLFKKCWNNNFDNETRRRPRIGYVFEVNYQQLQLSSLENDEMDYNEYNNFSTFNNHILKKLTH